MCKLVVSSHIDFKVLINQAGSEEGARVLFQRMVTSLVNVKHKDAREIRPSPGDWGIDILVGRLTGMNLVWQVKYFINGIGAAQQAQIRESFNQVMKKSREEDFTVNSWTLCVPCSLSPKETRWWGSWSKKAAKENGVKIELMDESAIRSELESPDAQHIKSGYFGGNPTMSYYFINARGKHSEREIQELPDPELYNEAMFIKKLKAGEIQEHKSAKTQFFNAELLTQEIIDKGDLSEITSLKSLKEKLRSMWETRFNDACNISDDEIKRIYATLMKAIEDHDRDSLDSPNTKASLIHKQGMVQQMADKCEVGWTKKFRKEFKDYYEEGA